LIPWISFDEIEQSKVLVVGAGALGNEVAKNLVLSGFRKLTIVDMDKIEISNLNRCIFFTMEDAERKRHKASVVATKIMDMGLDIEVSYHNSKIQDLPEDFIASHDMVFGCVDNIGTRLHLNAFCYFHKRPYIDGATSGFSGKVQVILAPETPCIECSMNESHMRALDRRYSCTGSEISYHEAPQPSEITTTSVVAAIQVREGVKIASGYENILLNRIFYYNGEKNQLEEIEIEINPNCQHHSFVEQ
jgi:molybdopterin/thiamine biosynthesis adenylyltransferase